MTTPRSARSSTDPVPRPWCPHCGADARTDQDGRCRDCGSETLTGPSAEPPLLSDDEFDEIARNRPDLELVVDAAHDRVLVVRAEDVAESTEVSR